MAIQLKDEYIQFDNGEKTYKGIEGYTFYVYNPNIWTPLNGGACCYWAVPYGITSIKFEILSGGGPGGSSGGDYDLGTGGNGGNYASKLIKKTNAAKTYLTQDITSGATSFNVSSTAYFPNSGTITIDNEQMNYGGKTPTSFTSVTRGVNSTSAAAHTNGSPIVYWAPDTFAEGDHYTICAAGTSDCSCCCSCNMNCRHGCTSFVNGPGLSNFCAKGGLGGYTAWDVQSNCYNCHISNTQCNLGIYNGQWGSCYDNNVTCGRDIEFRGTTGSICKQYDCCSDIATVQGGPAGPFAAWHGFGSKNACTGNLACCSAHAIFPGGGGAGHVTAAVAACWGSFGAGGLVKVTFS